MRALTVAAALSIAIATPLSAQETARDTQIDFDRFVELSAEVAPMRAQRLLNREAFLEKASREGVLLLDTRSADAFEAGHIEGAVNLPFSDFTQDKLREVIGDDAQRPILIYCNNNFSDNVFPIRLKSAPLALNIPTFINLVGYGYSNVWELDGVMSVSEVPWVGTSAFAQLSAAQQQD